MNYTYCLQLWLARPFDYDHYRFSIVISSRGVVNHVFHPRGEDEEVVAIKKGLASIFAAKLHQEGEVLH